MATAASNVASLAMYPAARCLPPRRSRLPRPPRPFLASARSRPATPPARAPDAQEPRREGAERPPHGLGGREQRIVAVGSPVTGGLAGPCDGSCFAVARDFADRRA